MEENLHNEDLIRQLCAQHDSQADLSSPRSPYENGTKPTEPHFDGNSCCYNC